VTDLVATFSGFSQTLADDRIDYMGTVEQLSYLLFLKMAAERNLALPGADVWPKLISTDALGLPLMYAEALNSLALAPGIIGEIFAGAKSRLYDPVILSRLVQLVGQSEWTLLDADVRAAAFEGLLEKVAAGEQKDARQYFTPRPLVEAITRCAQPMPRAPEIGLSWHRCGQCHALPSPCSSCGR
jgi:type I restriction enzyme M protein